MAVPESINLRSKIDINHISSTLPIPTLWLRINVRPHLTDSITTDCYKQQLCGSKRYSSGIILLTFTSLIFFIASFLLLLNSRKMNLVVFPLKPHLIL